MKVLLRPRIYALWNEKSAPGSSTYCPVRLRGRAPISRGADFSFQSTHLHDLATDLHE
jgi:hypothetical protein